MDFNCKLRWKEMYRTLLARCEYNVLYILYNKE